jgi:hypothetical protein
MSPKKGAMHVTLFPTLGLNYIPADVNLSDLLSEERPIAMWHVYFDGCNASEEATGNNELQAAKDESWEYMHHPSLKNELEKANDFKTPQKVRVKLDMKTKDVRQPIQLGPINSLDLTCLPTIKHDVMTPSQAGVLEMFRGWEVIKNNFQVLGDTLLSQEEHSATKRFESRAVMQKFGTYLNDIGAKSRLLSAKIGQNPRVLTEGDSTLWEAMSELHTELKILELTTIDLPNDVKEMMHVVENKKMEFQRLDNNMTKMYTHYKGHLTSSNARMISLEWGASNLRYAPKPQPHEGEFDFGENKQSIALLVREEIQELRNELAEMGNSPRVTPPAAHIDTSSDNNPMFPQITWAKC